MSDRFPASIRRYHQQVMSNVMGRIQNGQVFALTPQEYTALSDLAGALNYWAAQTPETPVVVTPEVMQPDTRFVFTASAEHVTAIPFTVLYRDTFSKDMQSFVIGAIVGGALTAVISYFFGSSRGSAAKDIVIGELVGRRQ